MTIRKIFFVSFLISGLFLLQTVVNAAGEQSSEKPIPYEPLSGITKPNGDKAFDHATFTNYLTEAYKIGMGVVFTFAFLSFLYAGWEYVGSEFITDKKDARNRMVNAFIGIGLALTGYVLLYTINPDILAFKDLKLDLPPVTGNSTGLEQWFGADPNAHIVAHTPEEIASSMVLSDKPFAGGGAIVNQADPSIAGVQAGDVIKNINGVPIGSSSQVPGALKTCADGLHATIDPQNGTTYCDSTVVVQRAGSLNPDSLVTLTTKTPVASPVTAADFIKNTNATPYNVDSGLSFSNYGALSNGTGIAEDTHYTIVSVEDSASTFGVPTTVNDPVALQNAINEEVKNCPTENISKDGLSCTVRIYIKDQNSSFSFSTGRDVSILIPK